MKEKELNEKLKIKLLKICLFYLFKIEHEKFIRIRFKSELSNYL